MKQSLLKLLELQKFDNELDQLEKHKVEWPGKITALRQELESSKAVFEEKRQRVKELEKNNRIFQIELDRANEELKKHQARLYEVKTNKEYDALQNEIEAWKNSVSQNEAEIIRIMEEIEQFNSVIETDTWAFAEQEKEKLAQIEEMNKELSDIERKIQSCSFEKKKVSAVIEASFLSVYVRIRERRKGVAVVPVVRNACGGCFSSLPPQRIVETKRNDKIIRCESCGRILVWNDSN